METLATKLIIEQIREEGNRLFGVVREVKKVIVGQEHAMETILNAILCGGHILMEGVPGVAKTTIIKAIARTLGLSFSRIQFTPDLLPADLIGTLIYNPKTQEFDTKKGPIFANFILADEINRAPAKVQSALLEAMQERQVTIGSNTFKIDRPFLVFATQNPIEQEGTYRLPEAQLDRFLFKLQIDYPTFMQEKEIMTRESDPAKLSCILSQREIIAAQEMLKNVYVDEKIIDYITHIIFATRLPKMYGLDTINPYILYGVSPRASRALYNASKARAFLKQRHYVTPDDVKYMAAAVLRHRLILTYEAEAENVTTDSIIGTILSVVKAP